MGRFSYLKALWKGIRPVVIGATAFLITGEMESIPQEIATPATVLVLEFLRNWLKVRIGFKMPI